MRVVKPQVFNPYEFSRPSPARYYDADGTLQTVGNDILRLGYNPTTLEFIGPIIENAATNIVLYSDDFSNAAWNKISTPTLTYNAGISVDGTMNATLFEGDGIVSQTLAGTGNFIYSLYVKPVSPAAYPSAARISIGLGTTATSVTFNFYSNHAPVVAPSPGAVGAVEQLQNGWYRISTYGAGMSGLTPGFSGSLLDHFLLGKAQVESGSVVTSYIETTSTSETRAADVSISQSPSVIETNIEENDADVWDSGTSYTIGNEVMVLGEYHRVYESTGSNTDKFPPDNPTDWIDRGATVRWRMFDMNVGPDKQSIATDSSGDIRVLLGVDDYVDSITLLNVDASSVQIIVRDADGNIIYDYYVELLSDPDEALWWGWFFGNRRRGTTVVRVDLPPYMPVTIEVIASGGSGVAKIGKLIVGDAVLIGCARYGTGVGIVDFSRKEQDPFGNYYVLERRFISRCNYDVQIDSNQVDNVHSLLAEVRATPCVYIGSTEKYKSTVVFGFYRDFDIVIPGPRKSACSLQVQGI